MPVWLGITFLTQGEEAEVSQRQKGNSGTTFGPTTPLVFLPCVSDTHRELLGQQRCVLLVDPEDEWLQQRVQFGFRISKWLAALQHQLSEFAPLLKKLDERAAFTLVAEPFRHEPRKPEQLMVC